jgi:hypothetical protein
LLGATPPASRGSQLFSPLVSCFHDLGNGTGLQGFVGKTASPNRQALDDLESNLHYGIALHGPLPGSGEAAASPPVYLFVEALARHRQNLEAAAPAVPTWELLPGVYWQTGDRCWISGGVLVPFGTSRPDTGLWQFTCSWQF